MSSSSLTSSSSASNEETNSSSVTAAASSQVRVGVRIRPLTSKESCQGGQPVVSACPINRTVEIGDNGQRKFTYDAAFNSNVTQPELYETVARPLLSSFLDGYNATIMAYGQTGSGKTYTMGSEAHHSSDDGSDSMGLIPRFMNDIFLSLNEQKEKSLSMMSTSSPEGEEKKDSGGGGGSNCNGGSGKGNLIDYRASASFLEVYGEEIHDLLDEERKPLPLREDSSGGVVVVGLTATPVSNAEDALNLLHVGTLNRTTAATLMNHTSSRSHAVFTVYLQQTTRLDNDDGGEGVDVTTSSRFTFVDLAGSERMKKTGAEGERAREGIKINEGLLALGNVINALADDERLAKKEKVHVPYRQSKLTRLLQDALGGNSQTLFLACVSPSDTNASETLSTLQYANRARNIKNQPTKNVDGTALELQRLHALTYVLECELVKQQFSSQSNRLSSSKKALSDEEISSEPTECSAHAGQAIDELMRRKDVQEYIQQFRRKAEKQQGSMSAVPSTCKSRFSSIGNSTVPSMSTMQPLSHRVTTKNESVSHLSSVVPTLGGSKSVTSSNTVNFHARSQAVAQNLEIEELEETLLEVNPDEDMAILDQLLELQHHDQEFDKEQKVDQEKLKRVEGELEEQEGLLLQLRESLKVYHNMKEKYEILMGEVQSLEAEKSSLAEQLENAKVDPSKGCSVAIKKKLEKVETSLQRARSETRKHQQMYRKAEQEAQKCRVLERKISELKAGKVALTKKQREATAKHREYTEAKTREIQALKRRERKKDKQMSKLEAECQKYKNNLERRKTYCNKLSDKLKQTESHLMKLLAMKKRNLNNCNKSANSHRNLVSHSKHDDQDTETEGFAKRNEEIKSIKFLLDKMVSDRVSLSQMSVRYETKVTEYGELMRSMVSEMKFLDEARKEMKKYDGTGAAIRYTEIVREHEQNVEEYELKLELIGSELEDLRKRLPHLDEGSSTADENNSDPAPQSKSELSALKMISNLDAPVTRTLLWDVLDLFTKVELERKNLEESMTRKDSAIQSFESEVDTLNKQIVALSNDFDQRRRRSSICKSGDPIAVIQKLEDESEYLTKELEYSNEKREQLSKKIDSMKRSMESDRNALAEAKEKLSAMDVALKMSGSSFEAEKTLDDLQKVWKEVGVTDGERDVAHRQIESCLEDTCTRQLNDAFVLRNKTQADIRQLRKRLEATYAALGRPELYEGLNPSNFDGMTMIQHLEALQELQLIVRPTHDSAKERRSKICDEVDLLVKSMEPLDEKLSENLQLIMRYKGSSGKRRTTFHQSVVTPGVESARQRRAKMLIDVEGIVKALEDPTQVSFKDRRDLSETTIESDFVHDNTLSKMEERISDEEIDLPDSLSEPFLDECERDVKKLRMVKSKIMVLNSEKRDKAHEMAKAMNLARKDVLSLVQHSSKKKKKDFPNWWKQSIANEVCRIITVQDGIVAVNGVFTKHLDLFCQSLDDLAYGRRALSDKLKTVVQDGQRALITTVEGMIETCGESSFNDALCHVPPLSKDHIHACIDEMKILATTADAMAQSEIEALTVVWDALQTTPSERGQFWSYLEDLTKEIQTKADGPFDSVLQSCANCAEEWVLSSVKDATKIHRLLIIRLLKLEKVHDEVEKQRGKQDAKSRIVSLDAEVHILSAKLADFEEKAGNKQRLLTKKMNSSCLLKEERFRKQMQTTFASKLESLGKMLRDWEKNEGASFDASLLSEDVRMMLANPNRFDSWVEERTAFMHLKTVKPSIKRRAEESTKTRPRSPSVVRRSSGSPTRNSPSKSRNRSKSPGKIRGMSRSPSKSRSRSKSPGSGDRNNENRQPHTQSVLPPPPPRRTGDSPYTTTKSAKARRAVNTPQPHRKDKKTPLTERGLKSATSAKAMGPSSRNNTVRHRTPARPRTPSTKRSTKANKSTVAKTSKKNCPSPKPKQRETTKNLAIKTTTERPTLCPFGNILATTPTSKENKAP